MQDGDISSFEFHKILQEVENYYKLKTDIRNQAKNNVKHIKNNSEKNFLNKDKRKVWRTLRKIANNSYNK